MTFNEWNKGQAGKAASLSPNPPAIDQTIIAPLVREVVELQLKNGSFVWTPEVQALEIFRQARLCRPPYKQPRWRPKA